MTKRPIILCPTQHELKSLRHHCGSVDLQFACCGVGRRGVEAFAAIHKEQDRPVILAGLAGGLTANFDGGAAACVTEIVDAQSGRRWSPTFAMNGALLGTGGCVITSSDAAVASVESKAKMAITTGANLVDLESVSFAEVATDRGWSWAIVRGVSDGPNRELPADIDTWLDANGRVRLGNVVRRLIRQPNLIQDLLRLNRESKAALMAVALILKRI